jgi:cell growth-regulating nucleolar protein
MVFFVCDYCNETLKKNQVEKHCFKCRSCNSVTCVDCSVTFFENDYAAHIVCISEAEKYEKSLFKAKTKVNPQDAWMEQVGRAVSDSSNAPSEIRSYLVKLEEFSNVPRNRKKFDNFISNSLKIHSDDLVNKLWSFILSKQDISKAVLVDAKVSAAAEASVPEAEIKIPESIDKKRKADAHSSVEVESKNSNTHKKEKKAKKERKREKKGEKG